MIIAKSNTPSKATIVGGLPVVIGARQATRIIKGQRTIKAANSVIGSNVDTSRFKKHQTPTPAPDGSQIVFTLPNSEEYVGGSLEIIVDKRYLQKTIDFTETTSSTFTLVVAPDADEDITINYIKLGV